MSGAAAGLTAVGRVLVGEVGAVSPAVTLPGGGDTAAVATLVLLGPALGWRTQSTAAQLSSRGGGGGVGNCLGARCFQKPCESRPEWTAFG